MDPDSRHDEGSAQQAREEAVLATAEAGVPGGAQAPQDDAWSVRAAAQELGPPDHGEPVRTPAGPSDLVAGLGGRAGEADLPGGVEQLQGAEPPVGLTTAERDRTDGPGTGGQRPWDGRRPSDQPLGEHDRGDAWAAAGTTTDPSQAVGARPVAASGAGGDATYGSSLGHRDGSDSPPPATEAPGRPEPGREHLEAPPEARDAAAEAPETFGIDDTDTALADEDTTA